MENCKKETFQEKNSDKDYNMKSLNEKPKKEEKDDVWTVKYNKEEDDSTKWKDLTGKEKLKTIAINVTKTCMALGCLYVFICSISMLGDAFQILAGKSAGAIFANDSFLSNPITGLIIGILVTVLVQSSSTSTSIVVTMVAAGILSVELAIPIIMGTNIGTSVTNTIVSLSQSMEREQFRKAFAGATVHDIFNLLSVLIILPLELASGYLYAMTRAIVESFHIQGGADAPDILKVITDPVVKGIVVINKTVITFVAQGVPLEDESSMIKIWCNQTEGVINTTEEVYKSIAFVPTDSSVPVTGVVSMTEAVTEVVQVGVEKCKSPQDFLFANTGLSDVEAGIILLFVSLILLCTCLILMVKILNSMLQGTVAMIIKKVINANFKYPFSWVTGYLAMIVGAGLTFVVQSSSVFTSTMTPLVGLGVISLKRMYPLTLGSNIGTTTTSLLAALASDPDRLAFTLQIALVHLFFNISGILLWYPIPFLRHIPIKGAKALGNTTAKYRWFAVLYLINVFFLIPLLLLALSVADFWAMMSVIIVVLLIVLFVVITSVLQNRKPMWLPSVLRSWKFLPLWMRSLQPYDKFMSTYLLCKCCCKKKNSEDDYDEELHSVTSSSAPSTSEGTENKAFEEDSHVYTTVSRL